MTGVIERLRSWLRSVFGGEADPDAAETADGTTTRRPERQVVHRDDRPLETPGPMGPDRETAIGADAETSERRRTTGTGTGGDEASEPVSIPDAEAVAGGDDAAPRTSDAAGSGTARDGPDAGTTRTADPADAASDPTDVAAAEAVATDDDDAGAASGADAGATDGVDGGATDDGDAGAASGGDAGATDDGDAGAASGGDAGATDDGDAGAASGGDDEFACAVCGTAVDDPGGPCPLCRSSDVVPVSDARESSGPEPTRSGQTTVAPADDDEAVDRLRDLGAGSGRDG